MKKVLLLCLSLFTIGAIYFLIPEKSQKQVNKIERKTFKTSQNEEEENSPEERARFAEERLLYEYYRQVNPVTGKISKEEKLLEFNRSKQAKLRNNSSSRTIETSYISRGPSNFGGRTRALVVDITDNTGRTILAGGVSGGVFRTTNGGTSWTKVSSNDEIHNVTAIVQDPRAGEELTWYYGTGEGIGSSASLSGAFYAGQGIWKSTDGGLNWNLMPGTSTSEPLDNRYDIVFDLAVHPITGDLYAAILGQIVRYDGANWIIEKAETDGVNSRAATDIEIGSEGRVYVAFSGVCNNAKGVWTSVTGNGGWTRISNEIFTPAGRVVLALAPSNQNKLYVLFDNGNVSDCEGGTPLVEADLWMWNQSNTTFTNYSSKLPDEMGATCLDGNDPFVIQGGYDLVVSVKPDNDNFVVIGGTNAYKITNITNPGTFTRIGGYASATGYSKYPNHHPDIHAMVFNPFDPTVLFTGTDGGVHKSTNATAAGNTIWTSLNNNYQTFQYYHVGIDPNPNPNDTHKDIVIGGAQDNGVSVGGKDWGQPDSTTQFEIASGDGCSVAISRDDACLPFFLSLQLGTLYRDCPVLSEITPEVSLGTPYDSEFVTLFHLDQANNNALYYAAQGTLLRTTDATAVSSSTWTDMSDLLTAFGNNDYFQSFSTSWGSYNPSSSYLLMGGDEGHIYRLDDPQNAVDISSATDITPPTATIGFPSIVTGLAIHPSNNDIVLATYSNYGTESIFLTTNATNPFPTWTLVERNLDAHSIRSAAIVEANGETTYFVGTARGLYSSTDPKNVDWVREAPDQIGFAVVSDLKYRPSDNKLLIGTHGNGMYEATISSTLGVNDFENISGLMKLYPNPVQNDLNVKLPNTNGVKINYILSNLSGQIISKGTLDKETINVSQLTTGMYFLQLKTNDGRKGAKSFIKK